MTRPNSAKGGRFVMNKRVTVTLNGCDDSTTMHLTVNQSEYDLLVRLEQLSSDLGGGCRPILCVREETDE